MLKKKKGISLLEIMLTLTVAAGILAIAVRFYNYTEYERKTNDLVQQISAIKVALNSWYVRVGSLSGATISNLITQNFLPMGSDKSPWGGSITVQPFIAVHANRASISADDLSTTACKVLTRNFPVGQNGVLASQCQSNNNNAVVDYIVIIQVE